MNEEQTYAEYFSGRKLYGDDFNSEALKDWFAAEEEGYSGLESSHNNPGAYEYHSLNQQNSFRFLPNKTFSKVLGFGSADGGEFEPIASIIKHLTIIEPSREFARDVVHGIPADYVVPNSDGLLDFADDSFDLVICMSALHHVANVTSVVRELARCTKPGGYLLIREPVVSMGDWRTPRSGLTKHERGIPLSIMREIIGGAGLQIDREIRCWSPLTPRLRMITKKPVFNSNFATRLDRIASTMFSFMYTYHPTKKLQKFQPSVACWVLRKN
jgi:SAM-dependent methyltransferase